MSIHFDPRAALFPAGNPHRHLRHAGGRPRPSAAPVLRAPHRRRGPGRALPAADVSFRPTTTTTAARGALRPISCRRSIPAANVGDFRLSCLSVTDAAGARGADFTYVRHEVRPGKYALEGLPAAHDEDGAAETLAVRLRDAVTGLELELLYARVWPTPISSPAPRGWSTPGRGALRLGKAASACLDLPYGRWDLVHFHGRHAMERQAQRLPLPDAVTTVSSTRGRPATTTTLRHPVRPRRHRGDRGLLRRHAGVLRQFPH